MAGTHVLEAVIAATIMMMGVIEVSTFVQPTPSIDQISDRVLVPEAEDFLHVLNDKPSKACGAANELEQLVIDGVTHNETLWNERVRQYFGDDVETAMVLDNGHGTIMLHGDRGLMGTTRDETMFPEFGRATSIQTAGATGATTMLLDAVAARHSDLVRLKGDAVRTTILTTDVTGTRSYQAWTPTAIVASDSPTALASARWVMSPSSTIPAGSTYTITADDIEAAARGTPMQLKLQLASNSPAAPPPPGASIAVDLPRGWSVSDSSGLDRGWTWAGFNNATGARAVLTVAGTDTPATTLKIYALPPVSPARPVDVIRAHGFNGSFAESTLVVTYPGSASPNLPRQVFATTPYAVRPTSSAFFGASFLNGGEDAYVTQIDIEIPAGYDVWANGGKGAMILDTTPGAPIELVDAHSDPNDQTNGGTWDIVDARHARWKSIADAGVKVGALAADWWGATLPITKRTDQTTSIEPPVGVGPSALLSLPDGYKLNSSAWGKSPGILELAIPNATTAGNDGYPAVGSSHAFSLTVASGRSYQRANGSYADAASDVASLDSAIANSTFAVEDRLAPIGTVARIDADFSSMYDQFSIEGVTDPKLTIDLYAPSSYGCAPSRSWSLSTSSLPHASVDALKLIDITTLHSPDLIVGTSDHKLYAVNSAGAADWSASLGGAATALEWWNGSASDRGVLAGDDSGHLSRVDQVTGRVMWATCVAHACSAAKGGTSAHAVTGLDVDDAHGHIVAVSADGELSVLDGSGNIVGRAYSSGGYHFARFAPSGAIYAADANGAGSLQLRDASNVDLPILAARDGQWLALGALPSQGKLRAASLQVVMTLDASTLAESAAVPEIQFPSTNALVAATGDMTGDGNDELAIALDDGRLMVVDGGTGEAQHLYQDGAPPPPVAIPDVTGSPYTCLYGNDGQGQEWCAPGPSSAISSPLLSIGSSGVEYAREVGRVPSLTFVASDWHEAWTEFVTDGKTPTAVAAGAWGPTPSAAVGYDNGLVEARTALTTQPWQSVTPAQLVGKFVFNLPLPSGGFYGSDLVIATMSWTTPSGASQSARLADWIEVASPDGSPVTNPTYRAFLVFHARDAPIPSP